VRALDGVNFTINQGEWFGLVGETGCGKSVTAYAILRLIPSPGEIVGGQILFEGEDLLKKSEKEIRNIRGHKIAMVFQDPMASLNPAFTVGDQIVEAIRVHHKSLKSEAFEKGIGLLRKVGVDSPSKRMNDYPHELSGGMRQRAMIAMALSGFPSLLIADEPTTNVDVTVQVQILDLMKHLQEDYKASVLYITHDLGVVAEMCEKVAVMYCGNVVECADVRTTFRNAKHPYTRGLLNAFPKLTAKKGWLEVVPGSVPDLIFPPSGCRFHPRCDSCMTKCVEQRPPEVEVEPGHMVMCHLYS
jgi:oligopeptide/dipeptide ABC transporter ATP-binding protein